MKKTWNFEEILDFYYFFNLDDNNEEKSERQLHKRDRQIFLQAEKEMSKQNPTPHHCQKIWLDHRRSAELSNEDHFLPGDAIRKTHALLRLLLLIGGFLIGCGLALSYFVYTGKTPLNVFHFLTIFIVPQLLIIIFFIGRAAFSPSSIGRSLSIRRLLLSLCTRLFFILKKKAMGGLSTKKRSSISSIFSKEQGSLTLWPLFLASQLFGLGFNIGILGVTILKVVTTDLAFGWQSTLQLGSEKLFSIVQLIAAPWSWLLSPELSYPALTEIEGSRIILKDSILHLQTQNLTSWWPFLLLCLVVYGLLPRVILLVFGFFMEQRSFIHHLNQNKYEVISWRMLTPLVSTQAPPQKGTVQEIPVATNKKRRNDNLSATLCKQVLLLIPDDIFDNCDLATLQQLLTPHKYQAVEHNRIFQSSDADEALLANIRRKNRSNLQGVIVIIEAWMVPIQEHIRFLHRLVESVQEKTEVGVYFLGRPTPETIFTLPGIIDIEMWRNKTRDLHNKVRFFEPLVTEKQD